MSELVGATMLVMYMYISEDELGLWNRPMAWPDSWANVFVICAVVSPSRTLWFK